MSKINYTKDNTIIFTVARMNPPTPGHMLLVRELVNDALAKEVDTVYVLLSKTNDNDENPIACPEKAKVLGEVGENARKTMFVSLKSEMINETRDEETKEKLRKMKIVPMCVPDIPRATPFTPLITILSEKREVRDLNLYLIIGEDRANMLDSIADYFLKWENVNSVDGKILPREEMGAYKKLSASPEKLDKLDIGEVPVGALSASFVRNIVKNGRKDKFTQLYEKHLEESSINALYDAIERGLNNLPAKKSADAPPKPLKYRYPLTKDTMPMGDEEGETKKKTKKSPQGTTKRQRATKKSPTPPSAATKRRRMKGGKGRK